MRNIKYFLPPALPSVPEEDTRSLRRKERTVLWKALPADIEKRDYNDSHRALAPLRKADDAVEIDTTDLTIEEVADKLTALIGGKQ